MLRSNGDDLAAIKCPEKRVFQLKAPERDGLVLQIEKCIQTKPTKERKRFTHATMDKMGHLLAAINQKGDLLIIDVVHNKFWTIPGVHTCSVVRFSPLHDIQVILGAVSGQISILNIETGEVIEVLKRHRLPLAGISFSKGYHCLTYTLSEAVLWDLRTNVELQNLNLTPTISIKRMVFMPVTSNILACYQDDTMQVWSYKTFATYKHIQPCTWNKSTIKDIAFTRNGRAMVIGTHSAYLSVFLLDIWKYMKSIKLPDYIQSVRALDFVSEPFDGGANRILAILSGNGILYFYSMELLKVVDKIMTIQEIVRFVVSENGKYIACVLSTGQINLYLTQKYLKEVPPKKEEKTVKNNNCAKLRKASVLSMVQKEMHHILETEKLQKILREYGSYPNQHRLKIWTHLLHLPNNVNEYKVINLSTIKTPFDEIETKYPLESKISTKNLKKMLINICTWSPFFKNVEYLPVFVFPFVHVFQNDPVLCFEALITIIRNWCQHWFEYHPMPPVNILAILENILLENDVKLLRHLSQKRITSEIYGWSLLEMAFTENLSPNNWLTLWDHVFSNEPSFLLMAVVSYNITQRSSLLSLKTSEEITFFYHNQNPIDMKKFVAKIYDLMEKTSEKNHPRQYLFNTIRTIPKGSYPMFTDFPKAILEIKQTKEAEEYALEEDALKTDIEHLKDLQKKAEDELQFLKNRAIEEERVKHLETICKAQVEEEIKRIKNERLRIAELRKQLQQEEVSLMQLNEKRLKATSVFEKSSHLESLLGQINKKKEESQIDVIRAETELLRHYSDLLKNRLQIESLFLDRSNNKTPNVDAIVQHQQLLIDEINNIQKLVDSRSYLKQMSIATGLAAMDNLIERVENELRCPTSGKPVKSVVDMLQTESYELEMRVKDLLTLIEEHKKIARDQKAQNQTTKSLTSLEELIKVTELNSASEIFANHGGGIGDTL